MINNRFETQAEIYQALLDGKTLTKEDYVIALIDGVLYEKRVGRSTNPSFAEPYLWSLYQEPKKTMRHYRWLRFTGDRYFKGDLFYPEGNKPTDAVKRLDDDFIVVDEDGSLVEASNEENN